MLNKSHLKNLLLCGLTAAFFSSCSQPGANQVSSEDLLRAQNIVGGTETSLSIQKQIGVVGILISTEDDTGTCTGTLIDRQIVLTAAHCIAEFGAPIQRIVVVFSSNIEKATEKDLRLARTGEGHHEFFSAALSGKKGSWNDIALLKLSEAAPADFKTAKLADAEVMKFMKTNAMAVQAGFGRAEADNSAADSSIGTLRMVSNIPLIKVEDDGKEFLFKEDEKGSCKGDSGGPAYFKVNGKLVQIGVNSRGVNPQNCLEVGVYTNIIPHLDWIKKTSEKLMALSDDDLNPPKESPENPPPTDIVKPDVPITPPAAPTEPPGDDKSGLI